MICFGLPPVGSAVSYTQLSGGLAMQASQEPANRSGGQTPENDAPERGELAARRLPDHRWSVRRLRAAPCAARRAATVLPTAQNFRSADS